MDEQYRPWSGLSEEEFLETMRNYGRRDIGKRSDQLTPHKILSLFAQAHLDNTPQEREILVQLGIRRKVT